MTYLVIPLWEQATQPAKPTAGQNRDDDLITALKVVALFALLAWCGFLGH